MHDFLEPEFVITRLWDGQNLKFFAPAAPVGTVENNSIRIFKILLKQPLKMSKDGQMCTSA